jgi:dehydro coenzyme F420 reductase / coenzyme F420-0:L-glutamate ligase / coenzyme F420-1:gamma-L-glutamate ligase
VPIEIIPVGGIPGIGPGDDLSAILGRALLEERIQLQDGDVVVVTQKVVSKAEGRVVPEGPDGKAGWVAKETRRVVARRGDLVIAQTRHGLVCANAGVDASNIADGYLTLLPEDPDRSAEELRSALSSRSGAEVAVVITDTFGRPWRQGLVNVAIGCAGFPALVDLRGTKDATGRVLEATVVAVADEVAAASGLAMGKADGIPAVVVRGIRVEGALLPASALVRLPEEDLFRESPLQALASRYEATAFAPGEIPPGLVQEALLAAETALGTGDGQQPWILMEVSGGHTRARLAAATQGQAAEILMTAPVVVVGFAGPPNPPGDSPRWTEPRWDWAVLSAGAALQNVILAFHALGIASCWISPARFRPNEVQGVLGLAARRVLTGALAAGRPLDHE